MSGTDASKFETGAVLEQQGEPVIFILEHMIADTKYKNLPMCEHPIDVTPVATIMNNNSWSHFDLNFAHLNF